MVGDAFEDVLEIDLWIECVELGRAEQRVDGRCSFTTRVRTCEEEVLASECDNSQCPLGGGVIDLKSAVIDIADQCWPARESVADRGRGIGLGESFASVASSQVLMLSSRGFARACRIDFLICGVLPRISASIA